MVKQGNVRQMTLNLKANEHNIYISESDDFATKIKLSPMLVYVFFPEIIIFRHNFKYECE